jgi:hypothetical protein
LVVGITLAVVVGGAGALGALTLVDNQVERWPGMAAVLVGGMCVLAGGVVVAVRVWGISAGVALVVASVGMAGLLVGVCSRTGVLVGG